MDKFWEHIEVLAPGGLLVALFTALLHDRIFLVPPDVQAKLTETGPMVLVAAVSVGASYIAGAVNGSLARKLFTDVWVMDRKRWPYFRSLFSGSPSLSRATANAAGLTEKDLEQIDEKNLKEQRRVFHAISGRALSLGGMLEREISQRRREARLLRATVVPAGVAALVFTLRSTLPFAWSIGVALLTGVATAWLVSLAYFYKECTAADTLQVFAETLERNQSLGKVADAG